MFGYIVANRAALTDEQVRRYRACYCGLCQSLKQRHGGLSRLTLSYDMTFVVLLLSSLYEPETVGGQARCLTHPERRHDYWQNGFSDYAADLNIALTYYKCLDDWRDERKLPQYLSAGLLRPAYARVRQQWPRQCDAITHALRELSRLEDEQCDNPDRMSGLFGQVMAELLVYDAEDHWAGILRNLGQALGVFIYIMDACVDLERDRAKKRYNPLLAFAATVGGQAVDQRGMLTVLMGDVAEELEKLPLVQDIGILRNIVYSGVWQRYNVQQQTGSPMENR